jgi:hypothetical protein
LFTCPGEKELKDLAVWKIFIIPESGQQNLNRPTQQNFKGQNFTGQNFKGQNFTKVNFTGQNFTGQNITRQNISPN